MAGQAQHTVWRPGDQANAVLAPILLLAARQS